MSVILVTLLCVATLKAEYSAIVFKDMRFQSAKVVS